MAKSNDYVDKLRQEVDSVASREQLLIRALGEALSNADRKLLDDVRSLTIEHETRRALILGELQTLASRLGTFPAASDPVEAIEYEPLDLPYQPAEAEPEETPVPPVSAAGDDAANAGGDWRQALENIRTSNGISPVNGNGRH